MRGTIYRQCWCRDPETKKPLRAKCPRLKSKTRGRWYARYDVDGGNGKRRQPVLGPFDTRKQAEEELNDVLSRVGGGGSAPDRSLKVAAYLDAYMAGKRNLKDTTRATDQEAMDLYWKPALGAMRLVDVRDHHVSQVITAMELINQPGPDDVKPEIREMLRRMYAARADDERRVLAEGETRHKKSTRTLSPSRIARMFAPFRAAMNAAVPRRIMVSPCDGVELPRADEAKPLAWTPGREAVYREALGKQLREAEAAKGSPLTTVERYEIWKAPDLRPAPSMVWLPQQTAEFLTYAAEHERLLVLFVVTAFCGLRRDEVLGLTWAEIDLDEGVMYIRETGSGSGPKSEAGIRVVPLAAVVVQVLRAWRKQQAAERLAFGPGWAGGDLVSTREDGTGVPGQWVSVRFQWLAWFCDLPCVRFHDLRHGAASLAKASGQDTKYISELLGHSRTSFTNKQYVTLFPDVQKAAAEAAAAVVPWKPLAQDS